MSIIDFNLEKCECSIPCESIDYDLKVHYSKYPRTYGKQISSLLGMLRKYIPVYLTGITPLPAEAIEYEDMLINLDIYYPHMQYRRFTGKAKISSKFFK